MTPRSRTRFAASRGLLSAEYALRRWWQPAGIARDLLREGYVVLPGFVDEATLAAMQRALPAKAVCENSPEGTRTKTFYDARQIAELASFF